MNKTYDFFTNILDFNLNTEQLSAVEHIEGPALILAVPGSGKTTMLICRTMNLVHLHNVDPSRILSLTFSKAAAIDMNERYKSLFHNNFNYKIGFSTIHRFCYSVLLSYFRQKNLKYTLLESKESPIKKQALLKQLYVETTNSLFTDDILENLSSSIGFVKNMMIPADEYKDYDIDIDHFDEVFLKYEKYKKDNHLMDFDDMLTMCYKLLTAKPDILEYYQNKFDYVQVDESQDTSKIQHAIIKLLCKKHNNLYMVADDDQSIYGFRGAFPEVVLNFNKYYTNSKSYYLSTNYRSSKDIVNLCSKIIDDNKKRYKKSFNAFNQSGDSVLEMVYTDTTQDQAKYILESYNKNEGVLSQAVLFRNNLSMIPLIDLFSRNDVDFYIKDFKHSFFTNWCTQDIISFLKVALIPNDIESFERIYFKMNAYLSKDHINYLKSNYNTGSLFESLVNIPSLEKFKQKTMRKVKSNFEYLCKLSPEIAISFIEDELNYKDYLVNNCKKNGFSFENQNKYLDILKSIAAKTNSIVEFLTRLDELKKIIYTSSQNTNGDALKLYTMHASKGLEFDQVFIIDIDDNVFPTKSSIELFDENNPHALEEERRLFYVALSRAKSKITLLHTKFRNGQYNKASMFVKSYIESASNMLSTTSYNSSSKVVNYMEGYSIGDKLLHTSFGVGYLIDISGDMIMIEFKDSTKTLSGSLCIKDKIIIKI